MFNRQNCCEIMWGTGGRSLPLLYWKMFCTALQKKIPKCLSWKEWINTIDFPAGFKHDRNQRYLSLNEGKTTKVNWSEEGNVIWLIAHTYWCQFLPRYRSLGSKASVFLYMTVQLGMDVCNLARAKQHTCSFQCLPHLCSCHSADFAGWKAGYVLGNSDRQGWGYSESQKMLAGVSSSSQSCCKSCINASAIYVVGNHNFGSPLRVLVL